MAVIKTDVREQRPNAKRERYMPVAPLTATNVEDAINQLQANINVATTTPPTITATTVNFAQSPYTVLSSDFILEVDPTAGVVVINLPAFGTRQQPLEIKDATGQAFNHNVQLNATIEGQNPYLLDSAYQSITIRQNKAGTAWETTTW